MITEQEIAHTIQTGKLALPPLNIEWMHNADDLYSLRSDARPDLRLRVRWGKHVFKFGAEIKARYTQQAIEQAAAAAARYSSQNPDVHPMVIVPYLNENSLQRLEEQAVSGIDLCGNGVIVIPDKLLLLRTGYPNKYPSSEPIKNIYNGVSSLAARVFLSCSEYPSVNAIQMEIVRRGGTMALSTISKVLTALEADLIVGRDSGTIRLLQPEKLIANLAANYRSFAVSRRFQARYLADEGSVMEALVTNAGANHKRHALTGLNSVNLYASMTPADKISLYCTSIDGLLTLQGGENPVPLEEIARFPDIEIFETQEEAAYFDIRIKEKRPKGLPITMALYHAAPPIQTYLELMSSGPREKQTAEQVKRYILDNMGRQP